MASLSSVRIPRDAVAVFQRVVMLDDEHTRALLEGLSTQEVRDLAALKTAVNTAVGDVWQDSDVDAFVVHMMSMLALGGSHSFTIDQLTTVITEKVAPDIDQVDDAEKILRQRLRALLTSHDLVAFAKAADIVTEYDHVLHLSRIISDIRPVFSDDASADPMGALIVHSLRIDYFNEGRIKTISFAMDSEDLAHLKKVVERASEKQRALSRTLSRANLPEFDMTTKDSDG